MPNRAPVDVSGFINPDDLDTYSGPVVLLNEEGEPERLIEASASAAADAGVSPNDSLPARLADTGRELLRTGSDDYSTGFLSPFSSKSNATSSLSSEDHDKLEAAETEDDEDGADKDEVEEAEEAAEEIAENAANTNCDTSHSDKYCVYTVEEGDTLSTIAEKFGLSSTDDAANYELLVHSNKPDIVSVDDVMRPDQQIRIPLYNGSLHTVLSSQTLSDIAGQYGVTVDEIMSVSFNGISNPDDVGIGVEILIPNPKEFPPIFGGDESSSSSSEEDGDEGGESGESDEGDAATDETPGDVTPNTPEPPSEPEPPVVESNDSGGTGDAGGSTAGSGNASSTGFVWPVSGPISSYFGPGHPLGIDIDLFNNRGAAIGAAASGTVTFAGGNPCCSYGYYVVIDHGDGFQTLYAHLASIGVSVGESVGQGQYLGTGGTTGYSTGDHLHFEVQLNGSIVNPMAYLP